MSKLFKEFFIWFGWVLICAFFMAVFFLTQRIVFDGGFNGTCFSSDELSGLLGFTVAGIVFSAGKVVAKKNEGEL